VVVGRAGTGKTFALDAARAAWEQAGHPVMGTALAAKAAAGLQDGTGIPSGTLDQLLVDLDRPGPLGGLPAAAVVVVDEAGMVGTRKLDRLLTHAARAGAKVVLVGDPRQLPEIDAGGALAALARRLDPIELTTNRRQEQRWEREALDELRHGTVGTAVAAYHRAGRITLARTAATARQTLIDDWWQTRRTPGAAGAAGIGQVAMYAVTRADVDDLNRRARSHLRAGGVLTGDDVTISGRDFAVGDEVLALRNDRRLGIRNGTTGRLTRLGPDGVTVDTPHGPVDLPAAYLAEGRLTHSYATTVHKSQGATVDHAFLLGSDQLFREAGYVGLSRARTDTRLYLVEPEPAPPRPGRPPAGRLDDVIAATTSRAHTFALDQIPDTRGDAAHLPDPWAAPDQSPGPPTRAARAEPRHPGQTADGRPTALLHNPPPLGRRRPRAPTPVGSGTGPVGRHRRRPPRLPHRPTTDRVDPTGGRRAGPARRPRPGPGPDPSGPGGPCRRGGHPGHRA
jgi:ATP-dependent exoDNAse (exonuclease V) alpha subunit